MERIEVGDGEVEWCSGLAASGFVFISVVFHMARKIMRPT